MQRQEEKQRKGKEKDLFGRITQPQMWLSVFCGLIICLDLWFSIYGHGLRHLRSALTKGCEMLSK